MALSAQEQYSLAVNGNFKERVEMVLTANATNIALAEGGSTALAPRRATLAYLILASSAPWAAQFAKGIASDPGVIAAHPVLQSDVTDTTINAVIASIFNNYVPPAV